MFDFTESFRQGQEAANVARANIEEINSVFLQLNEQLDRATEGKIKIGTRAFQEPLSNMGMTIQSLTNRKTYLAIVAWNPKAKDNSIEELARWKVSESGYPCRVVLSDMEIFCEDKGALESALARLIAMPAIGKILQRLINREPKIQK